MRFCYSFLLVCAIILYIITPCYGIGRDEQNIAQTITIQSLNSDLMFIGVSERFSNRDDSIRFALEDAARKLSFFYSVSGESITRENIGSGILDFKIDIEYQLIYDKELDKFLQQLEYDPVTDVFENNNAVFVVTRVLSDVNMPHARGHSFARERPYWIDSPPIINDFIVGVGFAPRYLYHSDTIIKSYEDAVLAIIENINIHIRGENINYQNDFFIDHISTSTTIARGTLKNFYIIETWTDPASLSVWTLAVARGE